jgi:hypothetical protein
MSVDLACKGCMFRSKNIMFLCCDYFTLTGKLRGCPPGANCIHKTTGKRDRRSWNQTIPENGYVPKKKFIPLTDQEKRERHNALKRAERARKKAATLLAQE